MSGVLLPGSKTMLQLHISAASEDQPQKPTRNMARFKVALAVSFLIAFGVGLVAMLFQDEATDFIAGINETSPKLPSPQDANLVPTTTPDQTTKIDLAGGRFGAFKMGVGQALQKAETILGTKPRVYAALAVIGILILGIIVTSIVVPIVLHKQAEETILPIETPSTLPEGETEVTEQKNLQQLFLEMPLFGEIMLILVMVLAIVTLTIYTIQQVASQSLTKESLTKVVRPRLLYANVVCFVLMAVFMGLGMRELTAFSNLAFSMVVTGAPFWWFVAGFIVAVASAIVRFAPVSKYLEKYLQYLDRFLYILPFALFAGCLGSIGSVLGIVGASLLFVGYIASLLFSFGFIVSIPGVISLVFAILSLSSVYFGIGAGSLSFVLAFVSGVALFWPSLKELWPSSWSRNKETDKKETVLTEEKKKEGDFYKYVISL
jgi:hypothetical protein